MTTRRRHKPDVISCSKHGQNLPWYCCCIHVLEGAPVVHFERATETESGEAACKDCAPPTVPDIDLLRPVCAGCFHERVKLP